MFRKTNKEAQFDVFSNVPSLLAEGASRKYNDEKHWHNQFREQIVMRIDESLYKVLFSDAMGAPNAPIRTLIGMMILKESFGWSDSQLFEHCQFNLLERSALGLVNMNDTIPAESTYYLLRKRIYEHDKQSGENLMEKTFKQITQEQIKEFDVNGRSIRMDSKLIGSNIAFYTRYEIIHQTLCMFYKTLDEKGKLRLSSSDRKQLDEITKEEANKTVYRSTKEEIRTRLQAIGLLIYKIMSVLVDYKSEPYSLLQRVFNEQYRVIEEQQIELRTKEEISSDSLQSPHDPECAYRNKKDQQVKGYSVNITETCSEGSLNLITDVIVDKANTADNSFVQQAIPETEIVTGQKVEKVYFDGAYHSPANEELCKDIDVVLTGLQGANPRYDLELTQEGLNVTDKLTGKCVHANLAKKTKRSKEDRWYIQTGQEKYYFSEQAVNAAHLRKKLKGRTRAELNKRNNVEATIFQLSYPLRNKKTKYRRLFKQKLWAHCRCLWINFVRIINFMKSICQRTFKSMEFYAQISPVYEKFPCRKIFIQNLSQKFSILLFLLIFINYY